MPTPRPSSRRQRRRGPIPAALRQSVIFVVAVGGLVYEAALRDPSLPERPYLIGAYLILLGYPLVEKADDLRNRFMDSWVNAEDDDSGEESK